jgi:hypothetical protein
MSGGPTGEASGDFMTGKMRMVLPTENMEMVVVPPYMYTKMDGKWQKSTGGAEIMQQSNALAKYQGRQPYLSSTDLGMRTVGGVSYHAYAVFDSKNNTHQTLFIDRSNRIARIEFSGSVFTMSNFGESVSIVAPM